MLGGVGAAGGVATRAGADRLSHRRSSLAGLAASGLGGSLDVLLSRGGSPGRAGAISGAATSIAEDLFSGRAPSALNAYYATGQGRFLGAGAGATGRRLSNDLPNNAAQALLSKENLGEWGSMARTLARGDRTVTRVKSRKPLPTGGYTYPDQRTSLGNLIESKFGWSAHLSPRQTQAYNELGPVYRVDHMLPDDIGSLFAYPTVQLDYHLRDVGDAARGRRK